MFKHFSKIIIAVSVAFMSFLFYQGFMHDSSSAWKNFDEPKPADFTSLTQEEEILNKLKQVNFNGLKYSEPTLFTKPNIFESVDSSN